MIKMNTVKLIPWRPSTTASAWSSSFALCPMSPQHTRAVMLWLFPFCWLTGIDSDVDGCGCRVVVPLPLSSFHLLETRCCVILAALLALLTTCLYYFRDYSATSPAISLALQGLVLFRSNQEVHWCKQSEQSGSTCRLTQVYCTCKEEVQSKTNMQSKTTNK